MGTWVHVNEHMRELISKTYTSHTENKRTGVYFDNHLPHMVPLQCTENVWRNITHDTRHRRKATRLHGWSRGPRNQQRSCAPHTLVNISEWQLVHHTRLENR